MRYLSIDFGEKRIGLAVCDPSQTVVSPLAQFERTSDEQAVARIAAVAAEEAAAAIVVGLPVNMDGTEGPQAARARRFADRLADKLKLPVHFQNEQLTSFTADHRLSGRDLTRRRHKARQDAVAAAVILEDFLREQQIEN